MKESYTDVDAMITQVMDEEDWHFCEVVSPDVARLIVMSVYMMNDTNKACGLDIEDTISVIASTNRISVIMLGTSSYVKESDPICGYEELDVDIRNIFVMIDAAIERCLTNA